MPEAISCPHCNEQLLVPQSYHGEPVQCPSCRGEFLAGPLLSTGTAIAAGPGGKTPPANEGAAEMDKDVRDKLQPPPRHRPLRPRERLPLRPGRRIVRKPPRPAAQIIGFVIIGMALAGLVVSGAYMVVPPFLPQRPPPQAVFWDKEPRADPEIQQALRAEIPLSEKQIAVELQPLFEELGTAFAGQDVERILSHFDVDRICDELIRQNLLPEYLRRARASFVVGLRQGLGQSMRQQAGLLTWKKSEIKNIKKLEGNEAVVIVRHFKDEGTLKMRWWVTKRHGTWQVFDLEDLELGLRYTANAGGLLALNPVEMQKVSAGMAHVRQALTAVGVQRDPEAADKHLHQAAGIQFPAQQQAFFHLVTGLVRLQQGKNAEALAAFDNAGRSNPDMPGLDAVKGIALNRLGRWDEALKHLETYRDLLGDDAILCAELGTAFHGARRDGEAQAAYRKALDYNPKNADNFLRLLHTLRPGDSRADLGTRFTQIDNPGAHFDRWAKDRLLARDYETIEPLALSLQKIDPQSAAADHYLALAKAHAGKVDQALKWFKSGQAKRRDTGQRKAALEQFLVVMAQGGHAAEAYRDPDLGPLLRSEPFRKLRKRFPEPNTEGPDDS
jgi:tetratricopeptide (TPR) repeat protein